MILVINDCEHRIVEYREIAQAYCVGCNKPVCLSRASGKCWVIGKNIPSKHKLVHRPKPISIVNFEREMIIEKLGKKLTKSQKLKNGCEDCGRIGKTQWHHILPKSLGGSNHISNLKRVCRDCHDIEDAFSFIKYGGDDKTTREIWIRRLGRALKKYDLKLDDFIKGDN